MYLLPSILVSTYSIYYTRKFPPREIVFIYNLVITQQPYCCYSQRTKILNTLNKYLTMFEI